MSKGREMRQTKDIPSLLTGALIDLRAAKDSDYWAYTREYELGKLDVAMDIVRELLETAKREDDEQQRR